MNFLRRLFDTVGNHDWVITVVVFILAVVSLSSLYGIDVSRAESSGFFSTQITACAIGAGVYFFCMNAHLSVYRFFSKTLYALGALLLVLVLFFGLEVHGTTGWFRFGGFSFQPVEAAKFCLVVFLSWWIMRYGRHFYSWRFLLTSGFFSGVYIFLVLLQPDLGSALILSLIWFFYLISVGTRKFYLALVVFLAAAVAIFSWFFLFKDYQKERFLTFFWREKYELDAGYNVRQSIIAIGAGRFFGRGLGFGSQSQLHFLPAAQTDFIFAVIGEEMGFLGVMSIVVLYFVLIWRILRIAKRSGGEFGAYLALGVAAVFFFQIMLNFGGSLGFLPVTGVTLPFLSYGGSSFIMNLALLGMAQSVFLFERDQREDLAQA